MKTAFSRHGAGVADVLNARTHVPSLGALFDMAGWIANESEARCIGQTFSRLSFVFKPLSAKKPIGTAKSAKPRKAPSQKIESEYPSPCLYGPDVTFNNQSLVE